MWTAISLWVVHIALAVFLAGFAWHRHPFGASWPQLVIAFIAAYVLLVLAVTIIEFTFAWILRAPRTPEQRIGPIRTLRMIGSEFATLLCSSARMMSYRWRLADPPPAPSNLPIVLVHGVLCNAGVWIPMAQKLAGDGLAPVYALSYGPPLGAMHEFVRQLVQRIDAALAATGASQVIVVAHSMGGLVVRAYLHAFGDSKIARVVTIGAPHHGSLYALVVPGVCMAQMRPGNPWLRALPVAAAVPPMISLWSPHDSMVVPQTSSILAGATNVAFPGIGHNALLRDGAIYARVAAEIRTAQASAARKRSERAIGH